jgi:hypothetical protein
VNRRQFLATASGMGMATALGPSFWARALAAPAQPGDSPYGPLLPPNADGLMLPAGFTSRVIAQSMQLVPGTTHQWHPFPDGGACVPADDGGWIYVSNSENPPPAGDVAMPAAPGAGGVGCIRFAADGTVVDAYSILEGSRSNCAGGLTPWGTWLSCEEWEVAQGGPYDGGKVWECDPFGDAPAIDRPSLGRFKHEMAAVDPAGPHVYLTEDQDDGLFYRYTPPPGTWGSGAALVGGVLEAAALSPSGAVTWLPVADQAAPSSPLRASVPGATTFDGGEGCIHDSGRIYVTTKGDDRVWVLDIAAQTMTVLYDAADVDSPVLTGVDNIVASAAHDLYVAEDGGNMEVCIITPDLVVAPVLRMTGSQHGFDNGTAVPTVSEVTGLALSPDGNRLYVNSERAFVFGILYEVTGPFRGGSLAAQQPPPAPTTTLVPSGAAPTTAPLRPAPTTIPATGADARTGWAAAAAAAAGAALWRVRRRAEP